MRGVKIFSSQLQQGIVELKQEREVETDLNIYITDSRVSIIFLIMMSELSKMCEQEVCSLDFCFTKMSPLIL